MNWMVWLGVVVVIVAVAAVTGIIPRGGRPVANSRMMSMGRVMLVIIVAIIAFAAYRS
jgi:hypothetical protein